MSGLDATVRREVIPEEIMLARLGQSQQMRDFSIQMWLQNPALAKQGGWSVGRADPAAGNGGLGASTMRYWLLVTFFVAAFPQSTLAANAGGTPTCSSSFADPDISINEVSSADNWSEVFVRHNNVSLAGWTLKISKDNAAPISKGLGLGLGCVNSSGAGCVVDSSSAYSVPTWINFADFSIDKKENNQVVLFSPDGNVADMVTFTTGGSCNYGSVGPPAIPFTYWGNPGACNKCVTGVGAEIKDYYAIPDGTTTWTDSGNGNSQGQKDGSQGYSNLGAVTGCVPSASSNCFHTFSAGTVDSSAYCASGTVVVPVSLVYSSASGPTSIPFDIPKWSPALTYKADITASSGSMSPGTVTATWTGSTDDKTTAAVQSITLTNVLPDASGNLTIALTDPQLGAVLATATIPLGCVDHIRIEHNGDALTCQAETVTVKACQDSACSATYSGSVTTTLSPASGWSPATTITFSGGSTTAALAKTSAGAVTLGAGTTTPNPAAVPATRCFAGVTESCILTFHDAGFIFSNAANGAETDIPTQTAGDASPIQFLRAVRTSTSTKACEAALTGNTKVNLAYECTDPATCVGGNQMSIGAGLPTTTTMIAGNNGGSVLSFTEVSATFDSNGNAPLSLSFGDVGRVRLHAQKGAGGTLLTPLSGSSNAFVVKPFDFLVIPCATSVVGSCVTPPADPGVAGGGSVFAKAGEAFKATVTARNAGGVATPNFGLGSNNATETVVLTRSRVAPMFAGAADGALSGATGIPRGNFTAGVATVSDLAWSEVGVITLTATNSNFIGSVLTTTGTSGNLGRFAPDHFDSAVTQVAGLPMACPTGLTCPALYNGVVYSAQPFTATVTARNVAGATTQNYAYNAGAGYGYSRDVTLTAWDVLGSTTTQDPNGTLAGGTVDRTVFTAGAGSSATPKYSLTPVLTAPSTATPTDIYLRAVDVDGVSSLRAVPANSVEGGVKVVSGRARVSNAFGSEKLDLPLSAEVQYWNGNFWKTNERDERSVLTPALPITQPPGTETVTYKPGSVFTASGGFFGMTLVSTGPAAVDLSYAVDPWLQYPWSGGAAMENPSAKASFGLYPGSKRFIYRREVR